MAHAEEAHAPAGGTGAHGNAGQPPAAEKTQPPYLAIWGVLAVLMFAKVGVSLIGMPKWMSITILVVISLTSALLVALYYMHLKFEPRSLWVLAAVPIPLIFILILTVIQEFR